MVVRRILIVDDEPSVRDVMATLLHWTLAIRCRRPLTATSRWRSSTTHPPDLIITDVMTPRTSAERLIDRVSDASGTEWARPVMPSWMGSRTRVEQLTSLLHREEPTQVGQPIPADVRPVRPKQHALDVAGMA